ncbi:MAG: Rieske (2Fe-2S) protein [Novosphingobium sp.]
MSKVRIELPEPFDPGMRKLAFVEGRQIAVFNVAGELFAIDNSCPHAGGSLFSGKLEGRVVRCPSHGLRFDLASGCIAGEGGMQVATHPIERVPGGALIALP